MKKTIDLFHKNRDAWLAFFELMLIAAWTLWVCREYLNLDPQVWPIGGEFGLAVRSHSVWVEFQKCGMCFLWNGSVRGGYPSFGEVQGAVLHPFVAIFTLASGVANGAKLTLVAAFCTAGFAQWWISKSLGVGSLARVWSGAMVVVGGHLAARMSLGVIGVTLSTAMASLAIAAILHLALMQTRRAAIALAFALFLLVVSGQAYVQIGFFLAVVPTTLILIFDQKNWKLKAVWREFALAAGLAILLSAVLLLPLFHFVPNLEKFTDVGFGFAQKMEFIPLNLVINDLPFYQSTQLKNAPYPDLYVNFLGWVPVLLAMFALRSTPKNQTRALVYLAVSIFSIYFFASAQPFRWLFEKFPQIAAIRFPNYFAMIANPMVLGLSALGLDGLTKLRFDAPPFLRKWVGGWYVGFSAVVVTLLLLVPLVWSVKTSYDFVKQWLTVGKEPSAVSLLQKIPSDEPGWINVSEFDHYWNLSGPEMGYKFGKIFSPYFWKNHTPPPTRYSITGVGMELDLKEIIAIEGDSRLSVDPDVHYAFVQIGSKKIPCKATPLGGNIDVECNAPGGGSLFVTENYFDGWVATEDGKPIKVAELSQWLMVLSSAGKHTYQFRYQPWDVPLGFGLSMLGVVLSVWLWMRVGARPHFEGNENTPNTVDRKANLRHN